MFVYLINEQVDEIDERAEEEEGVHASAKEAVLWPKRIRVDFLIRAVF